MFTGLIETVGTVQQLQRQGSNWKLSIHSNSLPIHEIKLGDSIAINGTCLTVEAIEGATLVFHTLHETLNRTSLGDLKAGSKVNMERALKMGDRLDGHIVSGHIDTCTKIDSIQKSEKDIIVTLKLPEGFKGQFIEKGSIAIDGISLTIAKLTEKNFTVHLIPVTWEHTNLSHKKEDSRVNIETDVIGKYIERQFKLFNESTEKPSSSITMEKLINNGFI